MMITWPCQQLAVFNCFLLIFASINLSLVTSDSYNDGLTDDGGEDTGSNYLAGSDGAASAEDLGESNKVKSRPPDKDEAFQNVVQPTTTQLYGLASSSPRSNVVESLTESDIQIRTPDGGTIKRIQHKINNFEVWNSGGVTVSNPFGLRSTAVVSNGCANKPNGNVALKFGLTNRDFKLPAYSVSACKKSLGDLIDGSNVTSTTKRFIYDYDRQSLLASDVVYADLVEFRGQYANKTAFIFYCLFNTENLIVIKQWQGIQRITYGGNGKIGKYRYGRGGVRPDLPVKKNGNTCQLTSQDEVVSVYNMESSNDDLDPVTQQPYSYPCDNMSDDSVNGGYGPLADTFYNGVKLIEMMRNSSWGNVPKTINLTPSGKVRMAVHSHEDMDNAYWDGANLYFGDGSETGFYPLGSCMDVVGHEFGHAVTAARSKLIYSGESGCLNEAFSDILGEMAENYVSPTKKNDFLVASECSKSTPFLRNMMTPRKYSDYFPKANPRVCNLGDVPCQDAHYCSSVPNYIFYKMATSTGWTTQLAGRAWVTANLLFWQAETSLYKAGCDVGEVVRQFGIANGDVDAVTRAWAAAGINISDCVKGGNGKCANEPSSASSPTQAPTRMTQPTQATRTQATRTASRTATRTATAAPTIVAPNARPLQNCQLTSGLSAKTGSELLFYVRSSPSATYQNVQVTANNGDADLYIKKDKPPTLTDHDWAPYWEGSEEWVTESFNRTDSGKIFYIMIHASTGFSGLSLYACYY